MPTVLMHIIKALAVRWKTILACFLATFAISILYSLFAPSLYQSTASLVVDVRAPETYGAQSVAPQMAGDYLLTQEDILKSTRVAEQVVADTGLAEVPNAAERYGWTPDNGPLATFVANKIKSGLQITSTAVNSRVIQMSYVSRNPEFSASMANAFSKAYIDVNLKMQQEPAFQAVKSYTEQMTALGVKLNQAQSKLAAREKALGIVAGKDQASPDNTRLDALSSQLASAEAQAELSASRTVGTSLPETMSSPIVQGLQADLARLEGQRSQLQGVAGPNNPDYRQLMENIAALRAEMAKHQALVRQSASASVAQARSAEVGISGAVAEQRKRVIDARAAQNEISIMQQDVSSLQDSYNKMAARRSELLALGNGTQTNISVLSPAIPDPEPVSPRVKLALFLGVFGGLALGCAIALLLELMDRRIRDAEQLETWLGIPDLGSIEAIAGPGRFRLPRRIAGFLPNYAER